MREFLVSLYIFSIIFFFGPKGGGGTAQCTSTYTYQTIRQKDQEIRQTKPRQAYYQINTAVDLQLSGHLWLKSMECLRIKPVH